ncbi:hypothetical protein F5I97DRAFT_1935481 [Phlebopus sp. FC_14]|nr:hypothetical protein F5I97DRAFT_1935481 [Phlebopus sp. FC_14]
MSTATITAPAAAATSQNVTLPAIPEIFDPKFLDVLLPAPAPESTASVSDSETMKVGPSNAMMDALKGTAHHKLTENAAPAFSSTLSSTLDAFLGLRSGTSVQSIDQFLEKAWAEDPALTVRVIWHARSIHDGKADKELFYKAFGWLYENHPRTAIANLRCIVDPLCSRRVEKKGVQKREYMSHGYWKDLLNILALATVDELHPERHIPPRSNFLHNYCRRYSRPIFEGANHNEEQQKWARAQRVQRFADAHARLLRKLSEDRQYRALYIAVARLFAESLVKDYEVLTKLAAVELIFELSLAGKWAPTPGASHDRITNISSAICMLLHQQQVMSSLSHTITLSPTNTLSSPDMHILRCFYQRHILSPIRRYKSIPEPLMSANRWSEIVYSRVPSVCMQNNKEKFFAHDGDRFVNYLTAVEKGTQTISGATLLPHQLVKEAASIEGEDDWSSMRNGRTLVGRLREAGQLDNCIAVCDVSGSIQRRKGSSPFEVAPIWPAISLSLLMARLAKPPFSDAFITFSAVPRMVVLDPESSNVSLGQTVNRMKSSDWGMNTDFNAVFLKLILPLAVKHKIPQEQMIKRVFVFSDMQFDAARNDASFGSDEVEANAAEWKTNHDVIEKAYKDAGYEVPEIVYWDLSNAAVMHGITAPVTGEREGVALLSGYSSSLLKVFMDVDEEEEEGEAWVVVDAQGEKEKERLTPEQMMKKALERRCFDALVVLD